MIKNKTTLLVLTASLALGAVTATAQAADGKKLYMTCAACHGKDGKSPIMPAYPKIAGQNKAYVLQQLKDIMSGARDNGQSAAMRGVLATPEGAPRFSDQDLEALADYVSKLAP